MTLFLSVPGGPCAGGLCLPARYYGNLERASHAEIYATAGPGFPRWYYWLISHALVHGGAVFLISGSTLLGVIETVLHTIIDYSKCEHWIGINTDQALHILCKAVYVVSHLPGMGLKISALKSRKATARLDLLQAGLLAPILSIEGHTELLK